MDHERLLLGLGVIVVTVFFLLASIPYGMHACSRHRALLERFIR